MTTGARRRHATAAAALSIGLFAAYNANGRESAGSDSQPTKLAGRALALHGTLRLDHDVERVPLLAERVSFARDRAGHYRSAYSPVGSLAAGATAVGLRAAGVDLSAPRGPNLIAVLTASTLTVTAVCLAFLTLVRFTSTGVALAVAAGLGLGTNFWAVHSQTLTQHELVALGLAVMLFEWTRPVGELTARHRWVGAIGLGLAVTARVQTAPLVVILCAGLIARVGWRRGLGPVALTAAMLGALLAVQTHWFGHPLGALPLLEARHPEIHALEGSFNRRPWIGAAGLLVSPSRGLLVFSPVVLVAVAGLRPSLRALPGHGLGWMYLGYTVLGVGYSSYAVWWGGHSYGPRYLLDGLILLAPAAAVALTHVLRGRATRVLAAVGLAWSMVAAGTGAFFADHWNTSPASVDRHHTRLWDWRDPQVVRAWRAGLHPHNFNLFNRTSYRAEDPADAR